MTGTFPLHPRYRRVRYSYEWECDLCEEKHTSLYSCHRGEQAIVPTMPQGWRELPDGRIVCHLHQVIILVDGKVAE